MIVTKKVLALLLASLPFQVLGGFCTNDPDFEIDRPNGRTRNCNWIVRVPELVDQRRTNVCAPGSAVASHCMLACGDCDPVESAVFTMTNADGGNEIIMYARNKSTGKLIDIGSFSTKGIGGDSTLEAPPDDPLASQDSLVVADSCLLAVNAGSNTLTSFQIVVGDQGFIEDFEIVSVVGSGGDIPVSIAYNSADKLAYALNSGGSGCIAGFWLKDQCRLEAIPDSIVSLDQGPRDLPPPPEGPPFFVSSPAQIGFTPDGNTLLITIKGIDGNPLSGGTINHYDVNDTTGLVSNLRISQTGQKGSTVPFSFDFDANGNLLLVDAFGSNLPGTADAGSVTMLNFDGADNTVSRIDNALIGQTAACWLRYSNDCVFTSNNGSSSISSLTINGNSITLIDSVAAELNNPIDFAFSSDGKYMYALSTGHTDDGQPRIYVYDVTRECDLSEKQIVEDGLPNEVISVFGAVGMAIY